MTSGEAQPQIASLAPYAHGIYTIVPAFRDIYCNPLPADTRQICRTTEVEVETSWSFGAFAVPDDDGDYVIQISAGTAAMFDFMATAYILSNEATHSNACFYDWTSYYLHVLVDNQQAISARQALSPGYGVLGFARLGRSKSCAPLATLPEADLRVIEQRDTEDRKLDIESAMDFVMLHEMGHAVLHHRITRNTPLETRRKLEMEADNWAIDTALNAHQCIQTSFAPVLLADLSGPSGDWEKSSDHPLGIKRYLNFLVRMERGCESDPVYQSRSSAAARAAIHEDMERIIARTKTCVANVDQGMPCK